MPCSFYWDSMAKEGRIAHFRGRRWTSLVNDSLSVGDAGNSFSIGAGIHNKHEGRSISVPGPVLTAPVLLLYSHQRHNTP